MRPTSRLLQHSARLTLFTRSNCSLCETAKATVSKLRAKRTFEYSEIDVMASGQDGWRKMYEFDTPVVRCEPPLSLMKTIYTYQVRIRCIKFYLIFILAPSAPRPTYLLYLFETGYRHRGPETHASLFRRRDRGADGRGRRPRLIPDVQ